MCGAQPAAVAASPFVRSLRGDCTPAPAGMPTAINASATGNIARCARYAIVFLNVVTCIQRLSLEGRKSRCDALHVHVPQAHAAVDERRRQRCGRGGGAPPGVLRQAGHRRRRGARLGVMHTQELREADHRERRWPWGAAAVAPGGSDLHPMLSAEHARARARVANKYGVGVETRSDAGEWGLESCNLLFSMSALRFPHFRPA